MHKISRWRPIRTKFAPEWNLTTTNSTYQKEILSERKTNHYLTRDNKSWLYYSVIFVNENENENGEKRENNEFVNEN